MNRNESIKQLSNPSQEWDVIIIGGGASGLGCAVDAASRGYKTLLLEMSDFAKATSSRSTKLIHGGVRYLQNGDVSLVIEALKERGLMRKNAPHLVKNQSFVIPSYDWWNSPFYGIGLKIYDMMAGKLGLGPSEIINKEETLELIPNVNPDGLRGGVIYQDGQFDDARMAISLALTANHHGATLCNAMEVTSFMKEENIITGVVAKDRLTDNEYHLKGKVVINACGVFSDKIAKIDDDQAPTRIMPSQGVHIILDKKFLKTPYSILVPQTSDGRVMFAVPWHDHVIVGTTDTEVDEFLLEPKPLEEEIDFILENAGAYMSMKPTRADIKSTFAGLRPLAATDPDQPSKEVSRHHKVLVSTSGLVSILGGKWTTYRKMSEDTINTAASVGGLPQRNCITSDLPIFGYDYEVDESDPLHHFGKEKEKIRSLPHDQETMTKATFISPAMIVWIVRHEMVNTLEDVLARRTRLLFLDAQEAIDIAPRIATIMAKEMDQTEAWKEQQISDFTFLAKNYLATSPV